MMDIKKVLLQWFIKCLIKKTSGSGIKNENISNNELAEELHKPITNNLRKENYNRILFTIFRLYVLVMSRTRLRVNPHSTVD